MRLMLQNRGTCLALVVVLTLLIAITLVNSPALLQAQTSSVPVNLDPATIDLKQGETVTVSVVVDASRQPVDTVQVFLEFDPSLLQVVDDAGAPATEISFGPVIVDGEWRQPLLNQVDNESGRVGVAAGKGPPASGAPDLEREFVLAVFNLKAVGEGAATQVTIDLEEQESRLKSKAIFKGTEVTGEGYGLSINIAAVEVPTSSAPQSAADSESPPAQISATEPGGAASSGTGPGIAEATPLATAPDGVEAGVDTIPGGDPPTASEPGSGTALPVGIIGGAIIIAIAAFGVMLFLRGRRASQRSRSGAIPLGPASG